MYPENYTGVLVSACVLPELDVLGAAGPSHALLEGSWECVQCNGVHQTSSALLSTVRSRQ